MGKDVLIGGKTKKTFAREMSRFNCRDLFIPVSGDEGTECTPRGLWYYHQRVDGFSFVTHRVSNLKDTIKGYSIRGSILSGKSLQRMSVVYVPTTPMPEDGGENPTVKQVMKRAKWDNDDYVCRGLILNGMSDSLFDIYQNVDTSKEPWDTLEAKHMAEDASSKKFLDNDKPKGNNVAGPSVVNMVEHNNSSRYNNHKGKCKHHDTRANPNKKPKVTSWKCGKPRHLKKDYKAGNIGNRANGSSTKGLEDGSSNPLKGQSHVHFKRMQDMSKDGLIPAIDMDTEKCERSIECIFVGYAEHFKAYRFYVIEPNDSVAINSIIESKDAIFDENKFSSVPRPSQRSLVKGTKNSGGSVVSERVTDEIVQQSESEVRKSKRLSVRNKK
nr:zinc finger, CCHC-type [Tanacetum cinerariifolium]